MISQDTFPSTLKYCQDLVQSVKTRQTIDSSKAALYLDTRVGTTLPLIQTIPFAANESKLVRITYTHPDAPTPYASVQFTFVNAGSMFLNYILYRDTYQITDEYVTHWILQLRNLTTNVDTLTIAYGVQSNAPGVLTAITL